MVSFIVFFYYRGKYIIVWANRILVFRLGEGKLIGVGVGPGDSELLTLKAVKIIKDVPVICAPRSSRNKPSRALSIIKDILASRDNYRLIEPVFPMTRDIKELEWHWDEAAKLVADELEKGYDVAFVTLGDPSLYSTFSYLQERIESLGFEVEIVPGVTSFTGCAASASMTLVEGDEILVVVPRVDERLKEIISYVDTCIIMKSPRSGSEIEDIIGDDPREKKIVSIQNCSMKDETIREGFMRNGNYLSTTIIKFRK
ncbi:MAG: precorrin-2 C(20)-methyltransferase [Methanobacteriales archaeon]|nr:precorrin-2 C(20)-methyltransferase [Methanobacteriales archaeon]MBC7118062.1 precorrin-2 C(20)-methyltransferase [Methanobacteriaceae archaeon]